METEAMGPRRLIAFLRAINVGGHTVKMDRLRGLFEALGLAEVETFIASGNVIFTTDVADEMALTQRIEGQLHGALGFEVATFLRSVAEVVAVAQDEPFPVAEVAAEGAQLHVAFLRGVPSEEAVQRVLALGGEAHDFRVAGRTLFWLRRTLLDTRFSGANLERALGGPITVRNVTTVRRLAAKYGGVAE